MEVVVRPATVDDLDDVLRLYGQLAIDQSNPVPASLSEARSILAEMATQPGRQLVVAEADGVVVGTLDLLIVANMTHGGAPWAIVENIVVEESARGVGIGRALIDDAVRRCADADCYKIQLLSNKRRADAHAFYRNMGFEAVAEGFRRYLA